VEELVAGWERAARRTGADQRMRRAWAPTDQLDTMKNGPIRRIDPSWWCEVEG